MLSTLTTPHALQTIALALAFGSASAFFAHKKKKNPYTWFFIGFFLGAVGLLAILFLFPGKPKKRGRRTAVPKKMEPQIAGPIHKFWYYLDANHQQIGPISYNALSEHFKKGTVAPTTYVWNEEMESWKQLKEMIGSR